jgi:hypothetical protein
MDTYGLSRAWKDFLSAVFQHTMTASDSRKAVARGLITSQQAAERIQPKPSMLPSRSFDRRAALCSERQLKRAAPSCCGYQPPVTSLFLAGDFTATRQEAFSVTIMNLSSRKRTKPEALAYDPHTGPYAPDEYEQLHIVGHRLENGEALPVKVFIRDNLGFGDARLKMHEKVWRQWALIAGLVGFLLGNQ